MLELQDILLRHAASTATSLVHSRVKSTLTGQLFTAVLVSRSQKYGGLFRWLRARLNTFGTGGVRELDLDLRRIDYRPEELRAAHRFTRLFHEFVRPELLFSQRGALDAALDALSAQSLARVFEEEAVKEDDCARAAGRSV